MSPKARELCGVISAQQTYEHYLIGALHPVNVYADHKIPYCTSGVDVEKSLIDFSATGS